MTWAALYILYAGFCGGIVMKEEWDNHENSLRALLYGFLAAVLAPFMLFVLAGWIRDNRRKRRAKRDHLYGAFGGYAGWKEYHREHPDVPAHVAAAELLRGRDLVPIQSISDGRAERWPSTIALARQRKEHLWLGGQFL